ncbi:protein of unknown function [Bradyrhizobium vignae]|uniref:Uncharacterized protein n=1 Tax=Bradyrhizobium vignae TaxID=1549949 RepID=A0A2U3PRQ4_9BRAD|nr:protein of unknown function [Bradyrhizobium vignae]
MLEASRAAQFADSCDLATSFSFLTTIVSDVAQDWFSLERRASRYGDVGAEAIFPRSEPLIGGRNGYFVIREERLSD